MYGDLIAIGFTFVLALCGLIIIIDGVLSHGDK